VHTFHPCLNPNEMPVSTKEVSIEQAQLCQDVENAFAGFGVASNMIFQKHGIALKRSQVKYISGFRHSVDEDGNIKLVRDENSVEDPQKLIQLLCDRKYDHVILYHRFKRQGSDLQSEFVNQVNFESAKTEAIDTLSFTSTQDEQDIHHFAIPQRNAQQFNTNDTVIIGLPLSHLTRDECFGCFQKS
jgi:hypothetical protein